MNEYQKAYIALSRELLFSSSPLVITPKNPYKTTKSLYSSLECKIFFDKEKDVIYIFTYNGDVFDCKDLLQDINNLTNQNKQDLQNYNISIFLESTLLTGGNESKSLGYECFFGTLDSKDSNLGLDESKPIYHLIGEIDSNSIESTSNNIDSNNSLSTLQVFLGSNTLTLLNYSLIDSSLNIKLECNSKESKAILEKEQAQKQKDSSPMAQNDNPQPTAMLHPILEDNELKCPHNGVVKLKSNKGKSFKSKGIPMILESDLLNSSIIGCTNPLLSGGPCTMVATILPNARGLKKFNDDYPIMQDLVSSGVMSDKGFPLICTPKENTFRINSPNPSNANTQSKEALESQIQYTKPIFTICYKIDSLQKNSLNIYACQINMENITQDMPLQNYMLHLSECKEVDFTTLPQTIQVEYPTKRYIHKSFCIVFDNHTREYIAIIRKNIPKILEKLYKENEQAKKHKDYGYGGFKLLDNTKRLYEEHRIYSREIWLYPTRAEKLMIEFGNEEREDTQGNHNSYNALSNIYVR